MLAFRKLVIGTGAVGVLAVVIEYRAGIRIVGGDSLLHLAALGHIEGAVDDGVHVGGQVRVLAAAAGEDDYGGIGEVLGAVQQRLGVVLGGWLRQSPILLLHADRRAIAAVESGPIICIELTQLFIGAEAGHAQRFQDIDRFAGISACGGAGAGEHRVHGSPAEDVQLGCLRGQGQQAFVLDQDHAFLADLLDHTAGTLHHFFGDFRLGGVQHTGNDALHGAVADQVDDHNKGQQESQHRRPADHMAGPLFGQPVGCDEH